MSEMGPHCQKETEAVSEVVAGMQICVCVCVYDMFFRGE